MNHDDPDIDAHLKAALRHAPDREIAPPPAVSRDILRAARAAVQSEKKASWLSAMLALLMRPSFAAGLASLMLAVVVGVMWQDDETRPPPVQPHASETPAPAPQAAAPRADAGAAAPVPIEPKAAPVAPTEQRARAAETERPAARSAQREEAARKAQRMQQPPHEQEQRDELAPAPAATPAPAAPAPALGRALPQDKRTAIASSFAAGASSPPAALARLLTDADAASWQWRAGADIAAHALDDEMRGWVRALRDARGEWTVVAARTARATNARALQWLADGAVQGTLSVDDEGVDWIDVDGTTYRLLIDPATARHLRTTLPG